MTKEVFIRIHGMHMEEGDETPDPVEVICPGTYYKKKDWHYILYEEVQPGEKVVTRNTIKVKEGYYEVIKRGQANTHLIFEKGKSHTTFYETPYGSLFVEVETNQIFFEETEGQLNIQVDYELKANGDKLADCTIHMTVEAKDGNSFVL